MYISPSKLINEKAIPFSASLRHLQDTTTGQSDIMQGANDTSPVLKHKARLNRDNLYLFASSLFHILSCNKVVNNHCLCSGQATE